MSKRALSWGTGTAIALTVFLAGILVLVSIALREDVSLVQDKYYERGQEYDLRRQAIGRAQALSVPLVVEAADGKVTVHYPRSAHPAEVTGRIVLYRPSNRSLDRTIAVAADSGWTQSISLRDLQPGFWKVKIEWRMNGEDYYSEQPVVF
jgi:hypothetical protein